ncbi:MAG: BA14K family protein [Alphaproteobacteria bacterium]|nr:BA14K family protein [Alphaproteobacteria bacterium]
MPSQTAAMTPAVNTAKAGDTASNNLHQIRKRGRRGIVKRGWRRNNGYRFRNHRRLRGRYYGRRHRGGSIAAGIAGLIIGGAIAASRRDYGDRWERCDARYRTFRWSDGTYIPYAGGHRVLCPYLRR